MIRTVPILGRLISTTGTFIGLSISPLGVFSIGTTRPAGLPSVPVTATLSGVGAALLISIDATGTVSYTPISVIPDDSSYVPVVGFAAGAIPFINIDITTGLITAGPLSTYLASLAAPSQFTWNLKRSNTSHIRAAWAGGAPARNVIAALSGNSTIRGVDETAVPYNSQYSLGAIAPQLSSGLVAAGIPSGANNWFGLCGPTLNDYVIRDSRITVAGTTAVGSSVVQGGAGMSMSSATAAMTFTATDPWTQAEVYTIQNAAFNGATLAFNVDGGATTNIVQDATNTIRKTTPTAVALAAHTINIAWASGANALYGINCYDASAGRKEVSIFNWGISGGTASQMVDNTGSPSAGRLNQIALYPPDLLISECGLVNSWRNSISVAGVTTSMQTYVDAVLAAGSDFAFLTPPFDNSNAGLAANQQAYVDAMYSVAASRDVPVIDIRLAWRSWAYAVANGWASANDNVHPTKLGYFSEAQIIQPVIQYALAP